MQILLSLNFDLAIHKYLEIIILSIKYKAVMLLLLKVK